MMRQAYVTSCGKVPLIRNLRNGFVQAGPSGEAGSASSAASLHVSSIGFAAATCAGLLVLSSYATTSGASGLVLIDLWLMLSRKTLGGIGPRVDPMFASSS